MRCPSMLSWMGTSSLIIVHVSFRFTREKLEALTMSWTWYAGSIQIRNGSNSYLNLKRSYWSMWRLGNSRFSKSPRVMPWTITLYWEMVKERTVNMVYACWRSLYQLPQWKPEDCKFQPTTIWYWLCWFKQSIWCNSLGNFVEMPLKMTWGIYALYEQVKLDLKDVSPISF